MRWMILGLALACGMGAAPVRDNIYIENTEIEPDDVMDNEDAILNYLQDGVDTYAPNSITTTAIATGGVTSADILDGTITTADLSFTIAGGALLPAGAVYFMLTGSCPAGTTDISATYPNYFPRINATPATVGGAATHTHTAGTYVAPSHTHAGTTLIHTATVTQSTGAGNPTSTQEHVHPFTTDASGSGAITGSAAAGDTVPLHVTFRACQVN